MQVKARLKLTTVNTRSGIGPTGPLYKSEKLDYVGRVSKMDQNFLTAFMGDPLTDLNADLIFRFPQNNIWTNREGHRSFDLWPFNLFLNRLLDHFGLNVAICFAIESKI